MYSFPNFILPLVAGIIFDKIGIRFGLTIFFSFVVAGLAVLTVAGGALSFKYLLAGYGLVGFGTESSYIALDLILFKYFTNIEFAFANGLVEVIPLISEYSGASAAPFFYNKFGFASAFGLAFLICAVSYVLMVFLFLIDVKVTKHDK
jgi:MFS family permease